MFDQINFHSRRDLKSPDARVLNSICCSWRRGAGVRGGMDVKSRNIKLKLDRSKDPFPAERSLLLLPFIRAQPPSTSPSGAVMTSLAQVGETGAYCRSTTGIAIESVPINLHILSKRLRELVLAARGLL